MRISSTWFVNCVVLALALAGCSRKDAPVPPPVSQPAAAQGIVASFIEARLKRDPYFAVQAGRHEFDGQMPDWSRAGFAADIAELRDFQAKLARSDTTALTQAEKFEHEYLGWVVDRDLFWLASAEEPFRNPGWYLDRLDPSLYLTSEYAPLPQRMTGFLGYARAIPKLAADIRANLRLPLPKSFIEHGVAGFGGYATFFRTETPPIFAQLPDGQLKTDLVAANETAAKAMNELAAWLESQRAAGTDDFALGGPKFLSMLRDTERVDLPLEELERIASQDLERNRLALREACAEFAPRASLSTCVARMRANKPTGGTVEGARKQLDQLRQFVIDHKIVSIPSEEQAWVAESPPYNRGNFAYIITPGPYENPAVKATYYVSPPDESWSAADRNAYLPGRAFLLFVSAHEVWPGHYLQGQFANQNPSRLAALYWDYAFGEGWAHYAEEMMYDAGLGAGDPEMRVGMLANALLRDVRFVSALCLHAGCMTLAQSEQMFREQAFTDAGNARQQALRGTYDPGYLAYTLGKLMIRKLRVDWLAANPNATPQQFHDRFLSYGVPPVPLVRRAMLGEASGPPL